jgi:hypothetical protein
LFLVRTGNGAEGTFELPRIRFVAQQTVTVETTQPTEYFSGSGDRNPGDCRVVLVSVTTVSQRPNGFSIGMLGYLGNRRLFRIGHGEP